MKKVLLTTIGIGLLTGIALSSSVIGHADAVTPKDSIAEFTITDRDPTNPSDPDNGTLTLKEVPSFNYGVLEASEIYSGFVDKAAKTDGRVLISDTRLGVSDWTLSASMDQFASGGTKLEGSALNLSSMGTLGETLSGTIKDDKSPVELAKGNGSHGKNEFSIPGNSAKLTLGANPKAVLSATDSFETTINWNLSSTQPVVPSA